MPKTVWYERDGNDVYRHTIEDDKYYLCVMVGDRAVSMAEAKERRGGPRGRLKQVGDAQAALQFASQGELLVAAKRNPELMSWDSETRGRAWRKFMQSSESKPYRLRDRL